MEGTTRTASVSLEMGFAFDDFGYLVDLALPQMAGPGSLFSRDPEIKREAVFAGPEQRHAGAPDARLRRGEASRASAS